MLPASSIFWQIQELSVNLTKKNSRQTLSDINQLAMYYGEEVRIHFLGSLLDDLNFNPRTPSPAKDAQKILILQEEISLLFRQANFVTALCQVYESGIRLKTLQLENRLLEDYSPAAICWQLKLSLTQTLALAFALTRSQFSCLAAEATALLRQKLPEVTEALNDIHEDIVHAIVNHVAVSLGDPAKSLCTAEVAKNFFAAASQVSSQHSPVFQLGQRETGAGGGKSGSSLRAVSATVRAHRSLASSLRGVGFQCSTSVESFRAALRAAVADSGSSSAALDEVQVAELVTLFLPHAAGPGNSAEWNDADLARVIETMSYGSTAASPADAAALKWWDMDVVVRCLAA